MKSKKWLTNKIASLFLSLNNVEYESINQRKEVSSNQEINKVIRHTEGQLSDSLINGVLTQEVKNLRWRMYKILNESKKYKANVTYDENDAPLTNIGFNNYENALKKVKIDSFDSYPLEISFINDDNKLSVLDIMENKFLLEHDDNIINNGEEIKVAYNIGSKEYSASSKPKKQIKITRDFFPKFAIENFTKKLNVRYIDSDYRLLEFYVNKYKNEENKTELHFINEIKKIKEKSLKSNILDIKMVEFITYNSIGASDYLRFSYENISFDKIIEFDGHFVIKFKAKVIDNGTDTLLKYKEDDLELKYKNKEKK